MGSVTPILYTLYVRVWGFRSPLNEVHTMQAVGSVLTTIPSALPHAIPQLHAGIVWSGLGSASKFNEPLIPYNPVDYLGRLLSFLGSSGANKLVGLLAVGISPTTTAGFFKRSPRFMNGIYWEAGLFLRTPFTEGCDGVNYQTLPPAACTFSTTRLRPHVQF